MFLVWNEFLNEVWSVDSLNRYHNQYLKKLLAVSFCFLFFVVYLVIIVKFISLFRHEICLYRQLYCILASIQK